MLGRIHESIAQGPRASLAQEAIAFPQSTAEPHYSRQRRAWSQFAWPAAAAVLLGINVYLVFGRTGTPVEPTLVAKLPLNQGFGSALTNPPGAPSTLPTPGVQDAGPAQAVTADTVTLPAQELAQLRQETQSLRQEVRQREELVSRQNERITRLTHENGETVRQIATWRREYNSLAAKALPILQPKGGADVFTVVTLKAYTASVESGAAPDQFLGQTFSAADATAPLTPVTTESSRAQAATATIVWSKSQGSGTITLGSSLPPPPPNQIYKVWAYDDKHTYPAGTLPAGAAPGTNLPLTVQTASLQTEDFEAKGYLITLVSDPNAREPGQNIVARGTTETKP